MLNSFPIQVIVGTCLGFLSGLGVGGGSLLLLWLTLISGLDITQARIINLMFFLPAAVISCTIRFQRGEINIKPLLPAILAGCTASIIFTAVSSSLNVTILKKGFGLLLTATGIRELCYRFRKPK